MNGLSELVGGMKGSGMMPPGKDNLLFGTYQEQEAESERFWDRVGKCLGYTDKGCTQCGRVRVEKYENGELICEKCGWNETTGQYENFRI